MAWEFHVSTPRSMGMILATKHESTLPKGPIESNAVQPFVSFTEAKLGPSIGTWKMPSLYAINPVAVVYRLLNQRYVSICFLIISSLLYVILIFPYTVVCDLQFQFSDNFVYRIRGDVYSSTAYATLKGHILTGEERVTVLLRGKGEHVDVEIVSYSRAAPSIRGRFIWPLIGSLQDQFFVTHLNVLKQKAVE
jgi:hypothetical protein